MNFICFLWRFIFEKIEKKGVSFKDGKMVVDGEEESEGEDEEDEEEGEEDEGDGRSFWKYWWAVVPQVVGKIKYLHHIFCLYPGGGTVVDRSTW